MHTVKKCFLIITCFLLSLGVLPSQAQKKTKDKNSSGNIKNSTAPADSVIKTDLDAYKEIVTKEAVSDPGLFTVHKVKEKWYWEVPDSLLGRDLLVVSRISKSATGLSNGFNGYAGDIINNNVIRFESGPNKKLFLKRVSYDQRGSDENGMYKAVVNSNIQPIMQSFDVKFQGKDSTAPHSYIIEATEFMNNDNEVLFFNPRIKTSLQLGGQQTDKSYIQSVKSYSLNMEIKTVKT
jgi:hypothetical protein